MGFFSIKSKPPKTRDVYEIKKLEIERKQIPNENYQEEKKEDEIQD